MANSGDGWPRWIKNFDEWRERTADGAGNGNGNGAGGGISWA